jgi:hypothetical protein
MDPVVNKLATTLPDSSSSDASSQPGKSGASKFDKVRSQLKSDPGNQASPAESASPTTAPGASNDPGASKLQHGATAAPDRIRQSLAAGQHHLARLREGIESTPGASSMQSLQSRLISAEHQYTQLSSAVNSLPPNASPQQWLALQQQAYSMNENIGVLSKMVGQAASGVKSVLQTQV